MENRIKSAKKYIADRLAENNNANDFEKMLKVNECEQVIDAALKVMLSHQFDGAELLHFFTNFVSTLKIIHYKHKEFLKNYSENRRQLEKTKFNILEELKKILQDKIFSEEVKHLFAINPNIQRFVNKDFHASYFFYWADRSDLLLKPVIRHCNHSGREQRNTAISFEEPLNGKPNRTHVFYAFSINDSRTTLISDIWNDKRLSQYCINKDKYEKLYKTFLSTKIVAKDGTPIGLLCFWSNEPDLVFLPDFYKGVKPKEFDITSTASSDIDALFFLQYLSIVCLTQFYFTELYDEDIMPPDHILSENHTCYLTIKNYINKNGEECQSHG